MLFYSRPLRRVRAASLIVVLSIVAAGTTHAAEKPRLRVDDYQIALELLPETHKLAAHATVKVTALEDLSVATFQLNNALRVTKLVDANDKPLTPERVTQDSTIRFGIDNGLAKGASTTFTFEYEGTLENADDSPVQGLKLAYVGPDTSYLFYSGLWFPVAGYGVNRFTATISVTVPAHMIAIGSGKTAAPVAAAGKKAELASTRTFTFAWNKPSFPGTIIAGTFEELKSDEAGMDLHVFFKPTHQALAAEYASTAVKEFTYYVTQYGTAPSPRLQVVEIPDDTVPSAYAPEIVAIASRAITEKVNYRLLANTIARQWWGVSVS
ncbi:MAG: peptidase M1, partial [Terriglobales bacterium]